MSLSLEEQLFSACWNGNIETVKQLLLQQDININEKDDNYGYTPLIYACWNGHFEIVKILLNDNRMNANLGNNDGKTAFYVACYRKTEIVNYMLKNENIDINKANTYGWTPLMIASIRGYIEIIKYILVSGREININAKNNDGKTAIDYAREKNKTEILKLLEEFEKEPEKTRNILRKELGLTG